MTDSEYDCLEKTLNRKKSYLMKDVKDKLQKVAFDVVRIDGDDLSKLWQVTKNADGEEVIVAMFDDAPAMVSEGHWDAVADKMANINVFYRGEAVYKFAASSMGFDASDTGTVCKTLKASLENDPEFVSALIAEIPTASRELVLQKYPELKDNS